MRAREGPDLISHTHTCSAHAHAQNTAVSGWSHGG